MKPRGGINQYVEYLEYQLIAVLSMCLKREPRCLQMIVMPLLTEVSQTFDSK